MASDITFNDARDIISKKILIGRISIESLKLQKEFAVFSKRLQEISHDIASRKIELATELNNLFEQQLSEFSEERQTQCISITRKINELDICPEARNLQMKLNDINEKIIIFCRRIDELESTIPGQKVITNFKIKEVPK